MVNEFKLTVVHFARPNPMQICACAWIYRWTTKLWKIRTGQDWATGPRGRGAVAGRGPRATGPRACFKQNPEKSSVCERWNRTIKTKMWKQFTVQGNTQYLDILPKILKQYNNTKHSSIKMTPVEASKKKNESTVYYNLYGDMKQLSSKPKFKVGDKVRITKYKRKVFDKGYTPNWTEVEIFLIDKIQSTNPITYTVD